MIPLRDNILHKRMPIISVGLIILNFMVFIYEKMQVDYLREFLFKWGLVPLKILSSDFALFEKIIPFITSIFLHGSWFHLISNCWFIWIFADNVEDRLGHFNFLMFFILCGIGANISHLIMNLNSPLPAIGASGAISGVLGAYFILFPFSRILTLIPFFIFWEIVEIPAFIYLGVWFLLQFLNGIAFSHQTMFYGGVAWWAHIGGFLTGIFLLNFFLKSNKKRRQRL